MLSSKSLFLLYFLRNSKEIRNFLRIYPEFIIVMSNRFVLASGHNFQISGPFHNEKIYIFTVQLPISKTSYLFKTIHRIKERQCCINLRKMEWNLVKSAHSVLCLLLQVLC